MATEYQIFSARDDHTNLKEVLDYVATVEGHVRIVSVMWQPSRPSGDGAQLSAGYTIVTEVDH